MAVSARHALITQWLAEEGRLDVVDAAARLGVAQETVRRDLRALEGDGRLERVHGGAVARQADPFPGLAMAPPVESAETELGRRLWAQLPRAGTILLGTGALTLTLAQVMTTEPPEAGLTVVTNSLDAALALAPISKLSVYNIGGTVSAVTRAQEGDWALQELERLHVDVSVVCPAGITVDRGLGQSTPAAAAISHAEVGCARSVVAVVEAAALGRPAFVQFAPVEAIDRLYVAGRPDPSALQPFLDRGLAVTVVERPPARDGTVTDEQALDGAGLGLGSSR